jgi:hypothetical protein
MTAEGPVILGSGGRVGRLFRGLWAAGLWPDGAAPLWLTRDDWDIGAGPPPAGLPIDRGLIVLAGPIRGADLVAQTMALTRAVIDLVRARPGPVLFCSTAAVYGRAPAPQAETGAPLDPGAYGQARLAMEELVRPLGPRALCLRIGNVMGADSLSASLAAGPVTLDRLPDGGAPRRSLIGPLTLARSMLVLGRKMQEPGWRGPQVLNLAQPGPIGMEAICAAAGVTPAWRAAPPGVLPLTDLDLDRLTAALGAPLPRAEAPALVAEARAAGWRVAP